MRRNHRILVLTGSALFVGLIAVAFGQNGVSGLSDEQRLVQLERAVTTLDTQLQLRTSGAGAEDRTTRDFNLNARLDRIELSVQQLERQMSDTQRQASDALRVANQAQREAQMAQQMARSAQALSR